MGRTLSHEAIICRKAYLEGKPTHVIALETFHSPEAVDPYILNLTRVQFAVFQRNLTPEEAAFATQQPVGIVQQYTRLIEQLHLLAHRVYARSDLQTLVWDGGIEPSLAGDAEQNERGEQEPFAG